MIMNVTMMNKIEIIEYLKVCLKFIEINNISATNVTNKLKYGIIKWNDVGLRLLYWDKKNILF